MNIAADQYAVMGNPIAHSKSPLIHALFAAQTDQLMRYDAILVDRYDFADAVTRFYDNCGLGLNITAPFKQEAWSLVSNLTSRAQRAQAVNTIWLDEDGMLWGDTTDGAGLVRDLLENYQQAIAGRRVLLLGAGGASRGVLEPLLEQNPAELVIANRTLERAETLAQAFKAYGEVSASSMEGVSGAFDLVINGTSASLQGEVPALPVSTINENTVVYDMVYGGHDTPFMAWAKEQGAGRVIDGLGMLVEQAAESFYIWRGIRPKTLNIVNEIRKYLL